MFNEITKKAVTEAIKNPTEVNINRFNAQQARRILDRLVGYKISPMLWKKVQPGLSAGRVQSVALRIVCDRENDIKAFKSEEYWSITLDLEGQIKPNFQSKLFKIDGNKAEIADQAIEATDAIRDYIVSSYGDKFCPKEPNVYKSKKSAQEAHEAIRPTDVSIVPSEIKEYLEKDMFRLYELIWSRSVSCQMVPAILDTTTFDIKAGQYLFRSNGSIVKFSGWRAKILCFIPISILFYHY